MSAYTGLVAIQDTDTRPDDTPVVSRKAPLNLPHGWDFAKVYGERLKSSMPRRNRAALVTPAAMGSGNMVARQLADAAARKVMLPAGATPWKLQLMTGLTLLLFAAGMLLARRRRAER